VQALSNCVTTSSTAGSSAIFGSSDLAKRGLISASQNNTLSRQSNYYDKKSLKELNYKLPIMGMELKSIAMDGGD
jgi:hypothetical protein